MPKGTSWAGPSWKGAKAASGSGLASRQVDHVAQHHEARQAQVTRFRSREPRSGRGHRALGALLVRGRGLQRILAGPEAHAERGRDGAVRRDLGHGLPLDRRRFLAVRHRSRSRPPRSSPPSCPPRSSTGNAAASPRTTPSTAVPPSWTFRNRAWLCSGKSCRGSFSRVRASEGLGSRSTSFVILPSLAIR